VSVLSFCRWNEFLNPGVWLSSSGSFLLFFPPGPRGVPSFSQCLLCCRNLYHLCSVFPLLRHPPLVESYSVGSRQDSTQPFGDWGTTLFSEQFLLLLYRLCGAWGPLGTLALSFSCLKFPPRALGRYRHSFFNPSSPHVASTPIRPASTVPRTGVKATRRTLAFVFEEFYATLCRVGVRELASGLLAPVRLKPPKGR